MKIITLILYVLNGLKISVMIVMVMIVYEQLKTN